MGAGMPGPAPAAAKPAAAPAAAAGPATTALVTPTDVIVKPGESLPLSVKLFDANGNIGQDSRKFLQEWMDRYVAWVRKHAA